MVQEAALTALASAADSSQVFSITSCSSFLFSFLPNNFFDVIDSGTLPKIL